MQKDFHWQKWRVLVKLDPDRQLPSERMERLVKSPILDAIVVGGTQGITREKTLDLICGIRQAGYKGPLVQEISNLESVTTEADFYFAPLVLNTCHMEWLRDVQLHALKLYGTLVDWNVVATEGYLVLNEDSAVGRLTQAQALTSAEIPAYVYYAEKVLRLPMLYLEYSGKYGDPGLVQTANLHRSEIHLTYGGGIYEEQQVKEMLNYADTVVIGNALYDKEDRVYTSALHC